ncbi:hypothetical protein NQ317_014776 [Molorchus minor]|uniref:Uncharacterized protein n=1 Tax=Molorchus minor TaxID=1323400 RepID=A0ABQ9IXQ6_9CUCU|nr:hypothetical protein NQ317_014776 [Molorchus minor]
MYLYTYRESEPEEQMCPSAWPLPYGLDPVGILRKRPHRSRPEGRPSIGKWGPQLVDDTKQIDNRYNPIKFSNGASPRTVDIYTYYADAVISAPSSYK